PVPNSNMDREWRNCVTRAAARLAGSKSPSAESDSARRDSLEQIVGDRNVAVGVQQVEPLPHLAWVVAFLATVDLLMLERAGGTHLVLERMKWGRWNRGRRPSTKRANPSR